MPKITIDKDNFLRGESLTDFSGEGGFSSKSKGITIDSVEGVLGAKGVSISETTLVQNIFPIATSERESGGTGPYVFFNDTDEDLHIYTTSDTTLTSASKDDSGVRNYRPFVTNAIRYKDKTFVSSATDIAYDITSATPDYDWWTGTATGVHPTLTDNALAPHLFLIVSGILMITDSNVVRSWDGTTAGVMLTFSDTDQKIGAIELHNDNVYLSTTSQVDANTRGKNYLHIWDGRNKNNTLISKGIPLPSRCLKIKSWKGRLLMFFRDFLGEYDGVEIKKVTNINWRTAGPYNYMVTESSNNLFFINNYRTSTAVIKSINSKGAIYSLNPVDKIEILFNYFLSSSAEYLHYLQKLTSSVVLSNTSTTGKTFDGIFYSNWINFPENVKITELLIEFAKSVVSGHINTIRLYNEKLSVTGGSESINYVELNADYSADGGMKKYAREFKNINFYCTSLQVVLDTFDTAVKRITITYTDGGNQPIPTL